MFNESIEKEKVDTQESIGNRLFLLLNHSFSFSHFLPLFLFPFFSSPPLFFYFIFSRFAGSLKLSFTQIDPANPERIFSFYIFVDPSKRYLGK